MEHLKSQKDFNTPEGYFDSLHDSIMEKVEPKMQMKSISRHRIFSYAASIIIIAGVSSIFYFNTINTKPEGEFENFTVSEYMDEFSEIDLELDETLTFDEMAMNTYTD